MKISIQSTNHVAIRSSRDAVCLHLHCFPSTSPTRKQSTAASAWKPLTSPTWSLMLLLMNRRWNSKSLIGRKWPGRLPVEQATSSWIQSIQSITWTFADSYRFFLSSSWALFFFNINVNTGLSVRPVHISDSVDKLFVESSDFSSHPILWS